MLCGLEIVRSHAQLAREEARQQHRNLLVGEWRRLALPGEPYDNAIIDSELNRLLERFHSSKILIQRIDLLIHLQ